MKQAEIFTNFTQHLKSTGQRLTAERSRLAQFILSMKGHFSAEDVLKLSKSKRILASRATTYRLLPVLVKAGLIQQSLLTEGGQSLYEVTWNKDHHDHLICSQCNRVVEFQDNTIEILQREIASKYGFVLENHIMELVGRCKSCRDRA